MTRLRTLSAVAMVATIAAMALAPSALAGPAPVPDGRRVVVLSIPGLTWKDLEAPELVNLRALLDDSAIANVATRVTSVVSEPGEAYLTMGTGTRAVAPREVAGMSFQADEVFGAATAGDEYARRQHGRRADAEVVSLGWTLLQEANEGAEFGGTIGVLGEALEDAGVGRGWSPTRTARIPSCRVSPSTGRRRSRWRTPRAPPRAARSAPSSSNPTTPPPSVCGSTTKRCSRRSTAAARRTRSCWWRPRTCGGPWPSACVRLRRWPRRRARRPWRRPTRSPVPSSSDSIRPVTPSSSCRPRPSPCRGSVCSASRPPRSSRAS